MFDNLLKRLQTGERFDESELKQMFHKLNLSKAMTDEPARIVELDAHRKTLIDTLGYNDYQRSLNADPMQQEKPTFSYLGAEVPKEHGPELFTKSMEHFDNTDVHWRQKEVNKFLEGKRSEVDDKKLALGGPVQLTPQDYTTDGAMTPPIDRDGQWDLFQWDKDGNRVRLKPTEANAYEKASWDYFDKYGHLPQVNSSYRTYEKQKELYKKYHGKQAVALPGKSRHESGESIDLQDYEGMKPFMEKHGFIWSNYDRDPWHFDYGKKK